jgi:hypothetical protein
MEHGALALERWSRQSRALSNGLEGQWCRRFDTPVLSTGLDVVVFTRGDHCAAPTNSPLDHWSISRGSGAANLQ